METAGVSYMGGVPQTNGVLFYTHVGSETFHTPREMYMYAGIDLSDLSEDEQDVYYSISVDENMISNQIEIIHNFVSKLAENSEDLDPEFSKLVDKHFWDLV